MTPENPTVDDTLEAQPVDLHDSSDPRVVHDADGNLSTDPQRFWAQVFETVDARVKLVEVPEWGADPVDASFGLRIEVRSMSSGERANYFGQMQTVVDADGKVKDDSRATAMLLASVCFIPVYNDAKEHLPGKSKTRLFRQGDEARIADRSAKAVDRLAKAALELAGMDRDEEAAVFPETAD